MPFHFPHRGLNMNYDKLLLSELRLVPYEKSDRELSDELLAKAVTLNENLQTLGWVLAPADLAALAASPSLDGFYEKLRGMADEIPAPPMYPGFPAEVMQMDEAVFRFHQLSHYFSTYGLERLYGVRVKQGWLPHRGEVLPAAKAQEVVLNAKTIRLLPAEERYTLPLYAVLSRRERMTLPEREIVRAAITQVSPEQLSALKVGFKENLNAVYELVFSMPDRDAAFRILRGLCLHTGDVLRCVEALLRANRFHFRTAQKRFLVKLLESYPPKDFSANLILSGKRASRNVLLLGYLDYSVYSRSKDHIAAVDALRDGRLRSWESAAKSLLRAGDGGALDFIAQRPGMMLRMVAWLLRLGYSEDGVVEKLSEKAASLSLQTLVTNLNYFGKLTRDERPDCAVLYRIFETLLSARLRFLNTPLRGKRVRLRMDEYDLDVSELRCSDKSAEGGYIRSGIAFRIPQGVDSLRFFVYWNDTERVDVDLHTGYTDLKGEAHGVGWDQEFRTEGVVFSGDVTHCDAAEYIDVDLTAPIDKVNANVHLFSGRESFDKVETCYVGMMAIPKSAGKDTALYSEANCFFKHDLRQSCQTICYGYIDVQNRCLVFDGAPKPWDHNWYEGISHRRGRLSLRRYLELLLQAQDAELCEDGADVILVMGKPEAENEISLVDANFFME